MADVYDQSGSGSSAPSVGEPSLVVRLRDRREDAWNEMVQIYYPLVFSWCRRGGVSGDDVLDVIQEVFQAVSKSLNEFRQSHPGDTFRGWLRGIARHKILDFHRKRKQQTVAVGGSAMAEQIAALPDPLDDETDERSQEVAATVHRALEMIRPEFEPQTWNAFHRAQFDDETPAETAAALGITANAVYKAKARVLQRLRVQLGDLDR